MKILDLSVVHVGTVPSSEFAIEFVPFVYVTLFTLA